MADKTQSSPAATPPRTPDEERAEMDEKRMDPMMGASGGPRHRPARPDPVTGEVPAGPGDAGLEDRPELNPGSPGTGQLSNRRLGFALGIMALLAMLVFLFTAVF